jgi:hypothetical protein
VLHDCRQLVSWDVWLSPETGETLIFKFLIQLKVVKYFFSFKETVNDKLREGKNQVKSMWPLWIGLHMCYNENHKKWQKRNFKLTYKNFPSSDCKLQLVYMKLESLVIANQNVAVNMYIGLVHTARHLQRASFAWRF